MKYKKSSKWALFSLSDTSHAIKFGKKLQDFGWNIIATNETLPLLKREKINCISINEFTEIHDESEKLLKACNGKSTKMKKILQRVAEGETIPLEDMVAMAAIGEDMYDNVQTIKKNITTMARVCTSTDS